MSNNLRQIAKDLRSFVKRCKDVHYSDSLLISFLITGLLTIAPKLHADVASEQQEVTAQTYDAITDLRQSFMRARQENERSLRGAESELAQLLKQGDQVIKSPWASFQFGTGYTNNDWGTTYRGRGGKFLEYYKRDNDLTKYVFDKDKHLYGATNLNIPRNQEPNSLTINPANIHEPYKPYVPERLDNINVPKAPNLNPDPMYARTIDTSVPTQGYTPRVASITNVNSKGAGNTSWGARNTFDIAGNFRTYDGWNHTTVNNQGPGTTSTTIANGTLHNGVNYTIKGRMSDTVYANSTSYNNWWNPETEFKAHIAYSLGTPNNGDPYYTPGYNNSSTGYDDIYDRSITSWGHWNGSYGWNYDTNVTNLRNNLYSYYLNAKTESIVGTSKTYNTLTVTTVGTPPAATYYGTSAGGTNGPAYGNATDARNWALQKTIEETVGTNWYNTNSYYNNYWSSFYMAGNGDYQSGYRDTLIYNSTGSGANLTSLTGYIGEDNPGGSFAHLNNGTYTISSVDVELYNGNSTGNAGYVLSNGSASTNTMTFSGNSIVRGWGNNNGNNIAFNIQNNAGGTSSITGPVDVVFSGNNNSVYKVNNGTLASLTITNKSGTSAVGDDKLLEYNGSITGKGRIYVKGDDNIAFDNLAYVDGGSLTLGDVQMGGNNNIIVALQNSGQSAGATGVFAGDIKIQGAMSGGNSTDKHLVYNNIAILASSGQGSGVRKSFFMGNNPVTAPAVNVTDLNVGFGKYAVNSTLVYANNGTRVNVTNTANSGTITDGYDVDTSGLTRGYGVNLGVTSENTVMGYADGEFDPSLYPNSHTTTDAVNPSTVVFDAPIDMVSRNGVAYWAKNGGYVLQGYNTTNNGHSKDIPVGTARNTRAGAYNSIIAYADGQAPHTSTLYIGPSTIKINGNIIAADNLVLNASSGWTADDRKTTYNNIGALAVNGGRVLIQGATAQTSTKEDPANVNGSLIYGMGAYAKGLGSIVEFANGTDTPFDGSTATAGAAHVVSGENGALFATDYGQIKFNGIITHQNNVGLTVNDGTDTRGGRGAAAYVGTQNDHKDKSPFYVLRVSNGNNIGSISGDEAAITFNKDTTINMYDGILLNGNAYGNKYENNINGGYAISDYHKDVNNPGSGTEGDRWKAAKYRGMSKVTTEIKSNDVVIGLVNQAKDEIKWGSGQAGTSSDFLKGVAKYAGEMAAINNTATGAYAHGHADNQYQLYTKLINSQLKIDGQDVVIEDVNTTGETQYKTSVTGTKGFNDPFNDIAMESNKITVTGASISGDATHRDKGRTDKPNYQVDNVGLAMANPLYRWNNTNQSTPVWEKTKKEDSGFYVEKGAVDIYGGSNANPVTGLLVNYGTIKIGKDASNKTGLFVDHGNGIMGTDGSVLSLEKGSEIVVNGKYKAAGYAANSSVTSRSADIAPSGKNYGIVGISDTPVSYNGTDNSVSIKHEDGVIYVEGDQATGIYARNNNNADASKVVIEYTNSTAGTTGIDVRNKDVASLDAKGIGIALVNENENYADGYTNAGGTIKLKGDDNGALASFASDATVGSATKTGAGAYTGTTLAMGGNDISTGKNGIGIYAESADITLDSKKFTVQTEDNGVGLWAMDDSHIADGANHQKTFQYNYHGANDKNGFAMAFGGKNVQVTKATNDLDIKFTNNATSPVDLAYEQAKSKVAAVNGGTYKGIAGILVNTNDGADTVTNRGNIEEDSSSKTNVRAYGAVVNKGTFVNFGKIKLNDSLDAQASTLTSEDMKKVNVGIFANSTNKLDTTITNRGDITIGDSTNNKNIGSWAIYGYNVNTDSKEDGSKSKITINRNNYGIYSGDGNVNIQQTKILVGNDTVMGHVQTTSGVSTAPGAYPIDRQNGQYSNANDLLSNLDKPRELDSAIGVYIDKGSVARNINVSADMDVDRFSYGIVMAEKNGGPATNVTIGDGTYTLDASGKVSSKTATDAPTVVLASNRTAGGQVKSTAPSNPKVPEETKEQGNAVYYYSADTASRGKSWANVTMNGDYNTAYYTKGSMDNFGTIDLRSKYDVDNNNTARGYGNVGIFSANTSAPSTNYGTITTGMSDTVNMEYSAAMAAGRNHYKTDGNFDKTTEEGYIINRGTINVKEKEGIGMFATGAGSKAINYGNIHLEGESAIGMYLDRGAIGENYGEIEGNAQSLKGVVAINGGYIKNYGKINVTGSGSYGIVTDGSRFIVDANGNPTEVLESTDPRYTSTSAVTAGQTNGKGGTDLYGGTESSIEEGTSGNPKTTGVGTTITAPDIVPITKVSVDGIDTPIFNVESDAANPGDWAKNITVSSSIQTGGTRIIDLSAKNEWGNPVWEHAYKEPLSEVTSIGMYVDTSGVRYTNPIDGIQNLPKLGKVDLYFGPEATLYTNSKAIRIGDKVDENGNVTKSNILKPFNDSLSRLPGGAKVNVLSASLTWQVLAKLDSNNQLSEIYMSKVPYHSFAYDDDKSLVNFTNNLDNIYEIAKPESAEKVIFNKLNSLGNGEGHILAQAFDQMRGHIYGGVQQRIKATSDILGGEINGLRSESNGSKDSNKFKAFGQRNEYKTDTAGMPDWYSNAGGFAFVHEDETVRLGQSSGWYAGVVNNYYTFKDLSKSYENQAMAKFGAFKS
ncbi:autotransporter-associated N-terminal domain-containing protein, partial [Leptotrichia shahii]